MSYEQPHRHVASLGLFRYVRIHLFRGLNGLDCLFQTACFARGDKRNDRSTFVLLSFRLWRKSKPPAMRVVVDS